MGYKNSRKFTEIIKLVPLFVLLFAASFFTVIFAAEEEDIITSTFDKFEPGTMCRKLDASYQGTMAVICGVVRAAIPTTVETELGTATNPNTPLEGVSVYLYECDGTSPTCKKAGSLTNAFSSTSTDENGFYNITMRKIGNKLVRYLAFTCGGKLAGLYKVPSYASFVLNVPLNCPKVSNYVPAPASLNPVSSAKLSCDLTKSPGSEIDTLAFEGSYTDNYRQQLEFNFDLGVDAADSRYIVRDSKQVLGLLDTLLNPFPYAPDKGAFYSEDCLRVYGAIPYLRPLCFQGDSTNSADLDGYEEKLYNNESFTIMNFLPNIPIKEKLLFFKDLTARQDIVNYSQNPTAPAQMLHTVFSNCKGNTYLRKYGESSTEVPPTCSDLKACNSAGSSDNSNYRNWQYSGGFAKALVNPSMLLAQARFLDQAGAAVRNVVVCNEGAQSITIGDIQPSWSYCKIGESDCPYKLDKTYWNPEFAYFFAEGGTATKVGYAFEGANDSYYGAGANPEPFEINEERAGVPVRGGTYLTDNNYGKYARNNGLTSASMGIISASSAAKTDDVLNYVLQRPGATFTDKSIYEQGIVKIEDAGSNLLSFCENSNVNPQNVEYTKSNEGSVLKNNDFEGNSDHYFSSAISELLDIGTKGVRTPTSSIYMTTAALNRMEQLKLGPWYFDTYDSALTSFHGTGKYSIINAVMQAVFQVNISGQESKSYRDRSTTSYDLSSGVELRDDLKVTFPLNEANFESEFPRPNIDSSILTSEWRQSDHECYKWNNLGSGERCYEKWGVSPDSEITRTCKVNKCEIITPTTTCNCYSRVSGSAGSYDFSVVQPCTSSNTSVDCTTYDMEGTEDNLKGGVKKCAEEKRNCFVGGSWDTNCLGLQNPPAACDGNGASSDYWPGIDDIKASPGLSHEGTCPGGGYWVWDPATRTFDSCGIQATTKGTPVRGCYIQDAGPYACTAAVSKDSTFRSTQETFRIETPDYNLNDTRAIYNDWKTLAHPGFALNKSYSPLAFMSTNTSVTPNNSKENENRNKNKDTQGFGGSSPEYKMVSAHALYSNIHEGGKPIEYLCGTPTLSTSTSSATSGTPASLCTLYPVPKPEIIDLNELDTRDQNCNVSSVCSAAISGNQVDVLSPTFIKIVNAAANYYKVPAASLITYMHVIHKFDTFPYTWLFSNGGESALFDASAPWYGRIAYCDDTSTAAVGPYDWIETWFKNSAIEGDLDKLSQGRGATASRCNFLDATFAAAKNLKHPTIDYTCGSYNWDTAKSQIMTLTLGGDRTGSYEDDSAIWGPVWEEAAQVWNACFSGGKTAIDPPAIAQ